jgi:hypothetical protein
LGVIDEGNGGCMIKILLFLLLSFNCLAVELNECGMTKEEYFNGDIRCFEVREGMVYESIFGIKDESSMITNTGLVPEELETDYEKVD